MKIRLITLVAFLALPMLAQAADKAATAAATQRDTFLQALGRGATVNSNNQQYQVMQGVRASQSQLQEQPQQTLARVGGGKLIEIKGAFVVFTAAPQGGQALYR